MPVKGKQKPPGKPKPDKPRSKFYDGADDEEPAKESAGRRSSTFYLPAPAVNGDAADGSGEEAATATSESSPRTYPSRASAAAGSDKGTAAKPVGADLDEWHRRSSALNKTLSQILSEQDVQCYFVQFMHSRGAEDLLKFWLSASDFAKAARLLLPPSASTASHSRMLLVHPESQAPSARHREGKADQAAEYEGIQEHAVSIYSRYIALECTHPIGITESLRSSTISRMCPEDGVTDPACFSECQSFVEDIMEKQHLGDFLTSSYFRRYQVDILTSDRLHLLDVLYNTKALDYFREFMEQENAPNYLQFWLAVDNFEDQLLLGNHSNAVEDAMVLYNRYFSLQATEPLGFTDKVRNLVELNICSKEGPLADCFAVPKIAVLKSIDLTYFSSFRRSQVFYHKYLAELIRDLPEEHAQRRSIVNPDAQSIGSHDESVARDADASRKPGEPDETPLWSREHAGKMTLGYVNEYGVFISNVDRFPEPKSRKGGLFSPKEKKLTEKKEKEEMAWKVAQRIVTEVLRDVNDCSAASPQLTSL